MRMLIATAMLLASASAHALMSRDSVLTVTETLTSKVIVDEHPDMAHRQSGERPLKFAWGAELNGGVEMGGHDMSTIGIAANFGMQWSFVRMLGISAEADIMVDNSSRIFPVSLIFQTDFSRRRRLCFMDVRGGCALSYLNDEPQSTQPYGALGLGVTLAAGRTYASSLIVGCSYVGREYCWQGNARRTCPGMFYVSMRLGVSF